MTDSDLDSLFLRIIAGEIPADVLHDDERVIAIRDINPQAPTHVLVVPKAHYPSAVTLADADPALAGALLAEAGRVAEDEKIAESAGGSGYRLIFNTGAGAGQTVFHAHVHVLGGGDGLREKLV